MDTNKYAAMTVNERLWVSGLMDEFDEAVARIDTPTVIAILKKVGLSDESITPILEKHGLGQRE